METHLTYECILTLRCLLLKKSQPKKWEQLTAMEHHNELRKKLIPLWHRNEMFTVKMIRDHCHMTEFDPVEIHSVVGYSDINSFEIKTAEVEYDYQYQCNFFDLFFIKDFKLWYYISFSFLEFLDFSITFISCPMTVCPIHIKFVRMTFGW